MVKAKASLHAGIQYYEVFWGGVFGTRTHPSLDLVLVPKDAGAGDLLAGPMAGYAEFQRTITLQRLGREQPLRNNIFAFNASRTKFFPYQFKPLLKFLDSSKHRLLICDEVGLGKTIEAGLILLELRARQTLRTVLVVCPSNLRGKWRLELRERFGEDFRILGSRELQAFLDDYEENPSRATLNGIVSLETIRTERVRRRLEDLGPSFDLVVIDEAHHLRNFATSQREAGQLLAEYAQAMVMLTATPVHLGAENLFSLLNLLDPADFPDQDTSASRFRDNEHIVRAQSAVSRDDLVSAMRHLESAAGAEWFEESDLLEAVTTKVRDLETQRTAAPSARRPRLVSLQRDLAELNLLGHILTRTRKRDVHEDVAMRRARSIEVQLAPDEQRFYDTVTELVIREAERAEGPMQNLLWRLNTPQRRLASSIQGMVEFYRGDVEVVEEDDFGAVEPDEVESAPRNRSVPELEREIAALVSRWPAKGPDSKYAHLLDLLKELPRSDRVTKVLVFATFKHTVRYLERRLKEDGIGVVSISGDVPIEERPERIEDFRSNNTVQVMISTRVGSEGLDFQFCSTVVNYDLPWNPMEVEQRIGRLDRIGQLAPTIMIVNLWTKGTIEERILRRLYDRIGIFERSVGDLEAILGDEGRRIEHDLLLAALRPAEAEANLLRIQSVIENRRAEIGRLADSAASFVGADAFFDEEVQAIRRRRRYVTGEQLRMFVLDFLRNHAPKTRLEYDVQRDTGLLAPDVDLRNILRQSGRIGDMLSIAGAVGSSLQVTFSSEVAHAHRSVEFLSVVHPLVQAIAEHLVTQLAAGHVFQVRCESSLLPPGHYFFFVFRLSVRAARPFTTLEALFLDEDLDPACDALTAEELMGEMVERGQSTEDAVAVSQSVGNEAARRAEAEFLSRREAIVADEQATNDVFVGQRLTSLRTYFNKTISKQRDLLKRAQAERRQEKYQRMLRGTLTRLETEFQTKESGLSSTTSVTADHQLIALGIVEILPLKSKARRGSSDR